MFMRQILHVDKLTALALTCAVLLPPSTSAQVRFFREGTRSASTSNRSEESSGLGEAHFEIDEKTQSLIVTTDDETNEKIKLLLEDLDRPIPQVLIKVLFLEVTHTDDLNLGFDLLVQGDVPDASSTVVGDNTLTSIKTIETTGRTSDSVDVMDPSSALSFVPGDAQTLTAILRNDLEITLGALAEVSKLEVLSRPSVMALHNQEATITVGQEVPFIRNSRITEDGQIINTVEYEDIGIILTVTPRIGSNGMVELQVAPEISTLTGDTVKISEGVDAHVFAKRSAETSVVVPSGKTIVIGGLMEDQARETVKKVPWLGDITFLRIGNLFKRTVKAKTKTELLIFLTPTVIESGTYIAGITDDERKKAPLINETFTDEELKKHLPPMDSGETGGE